MNQPTIFLKLGGSLITDKTGVEAVREDVLKRVVQEIKAAKTANPNLRLVLGHGSGSFGHVVGAQYGTRDGVRSSAEWHGFTEVSASALRLNRIVTEALLHEGLAVISLQPCASAICADGQITQISTAPILAALAAGLLPVIHGDVAFDTVRGGTIVSTEEVMMAVADEIRPFWLLLAGETNGVYDLSGDIIPTISHANISDVEAALGGSRGTDVTGGMATKVHSMLTLVDQQPSMRIRIFSGLNAGELYHVLMQPDQPIGTLITLKGLTTPPLAAG